MLEVTWNGKSEEVNFWEKNKKRTNGRNGARRGISKRDYLMDHRGSFLGVIY